MLAIWQRSIVDESGNIIASAELEIFDAGESSKPTLYSDVDGNNGLTNPFNADSSGFARFYVDAGRYDIAVNGTVTWEDVSLGTAQARDVGVQEGELPTNEQLNYRQNILDEATLSLDFVNQRFRVYEGLGTGMVEKPYDQILTHVRASDKSGYTRTSVLDTVGVDTPVFDTDPATGKPRGLSVHGQRTNVLLDNRDLSTGNWLTQGDVTISRDRAGLDGASNTAWSITNVNNPGDRVEQDLTIPDDSSSIVASWYAEKGTSPEARFQVKLLGGTGVDALVEFDTRDGSVVRQTSGVDNVVIKDRGRYWRVEVTLSNNSTGNTTLLYQTQADRSNSGATLGYDYGQVELNTTFATPPIETGASQVTREADEITKQTVESLLSVQNYGIYIEFDKPESISGSFNFLCDLGDSFSTTPSTQLLRSFVDSNSASDLQLRIASSSGNVFQGSASMGETNKLYVGFGGGFYNVSMNETYYTEFQDQALSEDPISIVFALGSRSNGTSPLNSNIRRLVLISRGLTQAEAEALTTPESS